MAASRRPYLPCLGAMHSFWEFFRVEANPTVQKGEGYTLDHWLGWEITAVA